MTQYQVTAPNGKKYRITAPDGVSKEQALERLKAEIQGSEAFTVTPDQMTRNDVNGAGPTWSEGSDPSIQPTPETMMPRGDEPVGRAENLGRSATKGASELLGFPGEAVLGLMGVGGRIAGQDTSQIDALSPTDAIKTIFGEIGLRSDPEPFDTFGGRLAQNATEAIAGGLTGIGAASRAKGVFSKTTERLLEGKLGRFAGEDIAASIGGATLKTVGQQSGQSEGAANVLELAGNVLTGWSAGRANAIRDAVKSGREGSRAAIDQFRSGPATNAQGFSERAFNAASQVARTGIEKAGENVDDVVRNLESATGPELQMTTGPMSRSPAVQSMERALLNVKDNVAFADEFKRFQGSFDDFVRESIKAAMGPGVSDDYVDAYMNSSRYVADLAERRLQQATIDIQSELADLPPIDKYDYGIEVRRKLEGVYKEIDDAVGAAWSKVPDATTDASGLKSAVDDILAEGEPDPAKLPPEWAMSAATALAEKGVVRAQDVQGLRSSLLESARKARAAGDNKLYRRLNIMADAALESLNNASSSFPADLERARNLTKEMSARFGNDVISPILANSKRGSQVTPDNQTMEELFKRGEAGRTNMIALKAAFANKVPEEVNSYVLQRAMEQGGMMDGTISVRRLEKFKRDYAETLDELGLTQTIDRYLDAGKRFDATNQFWAEVTSEQGKTLAAKTIGRQGSTGADLVDEVAKIFRGDGSTEKILELFGKANQTTLTVAQTEKAKAGLKAAIADGALKSIYTASGDVSAKSPDVVRKVSQAMRASGEFKPDEIERFEKIADIAKRQADSKKATIFKGQSNTPQDVARASWFADLTKLAALKVVAPVVNAKGPGSLSAAQMIGERAKQIGQKFSSSFGVSITPEEVNEVLNRAVFDRDLYVSLLKNPNTVTEVDRVNVRRAVKAVARYAGKAIVGSPIQPSQAQIIGEMRNDDGN
jgi:hypothetical protein